MKFTKWLNDLEFVIRLNRIKRKFLRAIDYFKFGYNNEDWDYYYIIDTIIFKLERSKQDIIKNGYSTQDVYLIQRIDLIIKLFKMSIDEHYSSIELEKYNDKIDFVKIEETNSYKIVSNKTNEEYNEHRQKMKIATNKDIKCMELAFKGLNNIIFSLWT